MEFIKRLLKSEGISYLFFGGLTTLVNYIAITVFHTMFPWDEKGLFANALAFVCAVTFAYIVNKIFVFKSKKLKFNALITEICSFVGARLITFVMEEVGLWICGLIWDLKSYVLCTIFGFVIDGVIIAKLPLSILTIIINYFLCKFVIFKKDKKDKDNKDSNQKDKKRKHS